MTDGTFVTAREVAIAWRAWRVRSTRTARRTSRDRLPAGRRNGARAGASRMRAPPRSPARSHNGKRLGAHVISESESVTHFPAIQVYVSARSRSCATARAGASGGGSAARGRGRPTDPVARGAAAGQGCRARCLFTFGQHLSARLEHIT